MAFPDVRTQRRWTLPVVAAALVLLSGCGQLTVPEPGTLPDPETTAPKTNAPTVTSSPAAPSPGKDAEPIQLDFGELERRPAPVPYWSARDRAIHDDLAGTEVPYSKEPLHLGTLTQGRSPSYAVIPEVDDALLQLIHADGTARDLGRGYVGARDLAVSPDRRKVAWRGFGSDDNSHLLVAEVPSGRVLVEHGLGSGGAVGPFFSDDLVHVISESAGSGDPEVVRLSDGKSYSPYDPEVGAGAPDFRMLWKIDSPDGEEDKCHGIFQLGQLAIAEQLGKLSKAVLKPQWQSCDLTRYRAVVRPDGRYVTAAPEGSGFHPDRLMFIDLANDRRVLDVRADQLGVLTWSDDGDQFVVEALVGDRFALVTCDVAGDLAGSCGLSTDPMPSKPTSSWRHGPAPYVLAGDG